MAESLFPSMFAARERHLRLVVPQVSHDFDVRAIAPRLREAALCGALDALRDGETLHFVDDQPPLPMLRRVAERFGRQVAFEFREARPERITIDFVKCPVA